MMRPCWEGAAGNHGSSLKRCDSAPPILSVFNNSAAAAPPPAHGPLMFMPFSTLGASSLNIIHSTLSLSVHQ